MIFLISLPHCTMSLLSSQDFESSSKSNSKMIWKIVRVLVAYGNLLSGLLVSTSLGDVIDAIVN